MLTAQETYREMVKTQLAPRLRELGFKGSGRSYELPDPSYWAMVGLQASVFSDRDEVSFAVNLLVVAPNTWERERTTRTYLGAKPNANMHPGPFAWRQRLGMLVSPDDRDTWWHVAAGQDTTAIVDDALRAIEQYGLPAMRARMGR